jgi:hypothetical protein
LIGARSGTRKALGPVLGKALDSALVALVVLSAGLRALVSVLG